MFKKLKEINWSVAIVVILVTATLILVVVVAWHEAPLIEEGIIIEKWWRPSRAKTYIVTLLPVVKEYPEEYYIRILNKNTNGEYRTRTIQVPEYIFRTYNVGDWWGNKW